VCRKTEEKIKKNDFCSIYPGHKSEILGGKKNQKNWHAVLGAPGLLVNFKIGFDLKLLKCSHSQNAINITL
jgi:hypothetical protein